MDRYQQDMSDILTRTNVFKYLNIQQIETIKPYGQLIAYQANQTILTQGKEGEGLFVLLQGEADVSVSVLGEGNMQLAKLSTGSFFGEVSLLENSPCTATVTAKEASLCFVLNRQCYDAFTIGKPAINYSIDKAIVEEVIKRQRALNENVLTLMTNLRQANPAKTMPIETDILKQRVSMQHVSLDEYVYLHQLPFLQALDSIEFEKLIRHANRLELTERSLIIEKEKLAQSSFLILSGAVLMTTHQQKKRAKVTVHGPNTLICPISLMDHKPEIFNYTTIGPAVLLEITPEFLHDIEVSDQQLWYKCNDMFCRYIVSLQSKLNTLVVRLMTEDVVSLIKE